MEVLIVYATRYGATAGTTEEIAKILRDEARALIFYETVGADLAVADYYDAIKEKGYSGTSLDFLTDVICMHFKNHGYDSPQDFRAAD